MRRTLALALVILAVCVADAFAQVSDDTLVPRGRLRLQATTSFSAWDSRFGERMEGGALVSGEETLGSDLTDEFGTGLFPAIADLEEHLRALSGDGAYSGVLGATSARVAQDVTRVDVGAHFGVFDWLTVGVVVPLVKTRTTVEVAVRHTGVASDLGISPVIAESGAVQSFLDALSGAHAASLARAATLCSADPAGGGCAAAQSLADRVGSFSAGSQGAYFASGFFPMQGSAIAQSLADALAALDVDIMDAGLGGIGATMTFATELLTGRSLADAPSMPALGINGTALRGLTSLWTIGDVELSALGHILEGEVRDSASVVPRLSYSLAAGALVRLGTGLVDADDVFLDLGTGDGQMDIEARVLGFIGVGSRMGVHVGLQYGVQQAVSLLRRVAPPELVMPPIHTLRAVRWSPGSYFTLNIEPVWRLSPGLSALASYSLYSKGLDSYSLLGDELEGSIPVDITDLERESGVTVHRAGFGLRYSTLESWRTGEASRPLELHFRVMSSIAGSGGHTPVASRVEFGIRLFRGIWGGRSSRACSRDVDDSGSPPSMRAISCTRASPSSRVTVVVVPIRSCVFSTSRCARARDATCARCVTTNT